jgi:hypothetical protein
MDRPNADRGAALRPYTSLQRLFLLRLVRIQRLKSKYALLPSTDPWILELLNRATYSTFCDCIELGLGTEARALTSKGVSETEA